jgi:hypothetical protein
VRGFTGPCNAVEIHLTAVRIDWSTAVFGCDAAGVAGFDVKLACT